MLKAVGARELGSVEWADISEILTKYLRINGENFDCFLCTAQTRIILTKLTDFAYYDAFDICYPF